MIPSEEMFMRTHRIVAGALVCLAALSRPVLAQEPAALLVEVDWLSQHLNDRGLVVLQVGDKSAYEAGHIPGARFITEEDVAAPHDHNNPKDLMLELPPVDALRAKVASFSISDDSRIVIYFGKSGVVQSATRIIFTLDYLGLGERTSLLNGGLGAWQRAGKAVSSMAPPPIVGKLSARPPKNVVVDAEFVKSVRQRPNHVLVDARAPVFYTGLEPTMNGKRGHIPGAVNIPFTQIADNELRIDRAKIETLFRAAGVKPSDTVIVYCHVGQQATAVAFAARLLGQPYALYDGAFQDWAVNDRGPVEK
jgi:thiosulfate/3-mercaptopyruvate sulfurtransferase